MNAASAAGVLPEVAAVIEFFGSLLIAGYLLVAIAALIRAVSLDEARRLVARGAIAGLDFKMAATLLKTLSLAGWSGIGMFVSILALRVILKKTFVLDAAST